VACGTTCCEGSACCGSACQFKHSNGLGQFFFDCVALGTYDATQAAEAAAAWSSTGADTSSFPCGGTTCYARQTTQCAVWCYNGADAGKVALNSSNQSCLCPGSGAATYPWD
jgi:hypothetical protein